MREILFRAKTVKNVHWIWGDLFHAGTEPSDGEFEIMYWDDQSGWMQECIDHTTIGQFTGMKDIDGHEIWEGDIVEVTCLRPNDDLGKVLMAYVGYDNDAAAFCLYHPDGRHGGTLCRNGGDAAIKVVGNRYDNPELIKVRRYEQRIERIKRIIGDMTDKKIWHDLRKKPPYWKYVLAETTSKKMPVRVVYFTENHWWQSVNSHCKSFQSCKRKPKFDKSDFIVKRWAYIDNILKLE